MRTVGVNLVRVFGKLFRLILRRAFAVVYGEKFGMRVNLFGTVFYELIYINKKISYIYIYI